MSRYDDLASLDQPTLIDRYAPPADAESWLRVNFVSSADGAVEVDGSSHQLSSEDDMRVFRILRMRCDVLLTGAGTIRADSYAPLRMNPERIAWRREQGLPDHPVMAVVTRGADLDVSAPLFTDSPVRPIVITCRAAPADRVARLSDVSDVIVAGDEGVDFTEALARLRDRGLTQQLCEGGPHVLGELTRADLVDELCLTLAPILAGAGAGRITAGPRSALRRMELVHVLQAAGNLLLRYRRLG